MFKFRRLTQTHVEYSQPVVQANAKESPTYRQQSAMEAASPLQNDTCPPIHHSMLMVGIGRRKRMSYGISSLYRSVRLAQRKVLKDLDLVGSDYKLKEGTIQDYANHHRNCYLWSFSNL